MHTLSPTWLTDKTVDFEYKKYVLLAYLQHVEKSYNRICLYPPLAELLAHYQTANSLKEKLLKLENGFPKKLKAFDPEKQQLIYESLFPAEASLSEIEAILRFSLPHFERFIREGQELYKHIENEMQLEPIGVIPIEQRFGYLFVRNGGKKIAVYQYSVSIFESAESRYRGIHTSLLCNYTATIPNTFPAIKNKLLLKYKALPNPAVYAVETKENYPLNETTLPIARRMLVRHLETHKSA